jgi:catechol 2,3-dioxygenase-like lactoylglutathione lyase family enzyme
VFDHVTIRGSDRAASERFYDTVLGAIGIARTASGEHYTAWDDFSLAVVSAEHPVTRGLHIGFGAPSRERVDAFWRAGTEAGFASDGEPGPRPVYGDDYYGSFLLDPDGNSAEAVHFRGVRPGVDHLWIRVADIEASKRFYETIAPHARIGLGIDTAERTQFTGEPGSFSVLSGDHVTENLHMAFTASENQAVDDFHQAAIDAGYRDNGEPGERPGYHPGYYGAFVLDPDGNSVELVNHTAEPCPAPRSGYVHRVAMKTAEVGDA